MTKKKIKSFSSVSRLKKVVVVSATFLSLFGGMVTGVIAINNFQNYDNPYLFGFIFGTVGLFTGLVTAKKIKSKVLINQHMKRNYSELTMFILPGFIGLFLLLGQNANTLLSTKEKCENYSVVDKVFRKGGYRTSELNILVINTNGTYHRYITDPNYWKTVSIGQQINACTYKSRIGFDYLKLTNEN